MKNSNKPIIDHFPDFLDFLEVEKGLSNKTQENYDRYLKKFVEWLKKNDKSGLRPHQLTADDIWRYRLYLSRGAKAQNNQNLKKVTQNYYLIALRALLNYFSDRDITSLPANKIKLARDAKSGQNIKFLTLEQIEKLLLSPDTQTKSGLRDRAILETLFSTGLRVAELANLNRDQILLKKLDEDLEVSVVGKGNYRRTVYLSPRCLLWLKKYLEGRQDDDKALFIHFRAPKSADSLRLSIRSIERIVQKYTYLAGISVPTSPHTIRHSYATDLLTQGVDLRVIQEFLGHRNISTTQIYTHVTSKRLKDIHHQFHSGERMRNE